MARSVFVFAGWASEAELRAHLDELKRAPDKKDSKKTPNSS